MDATIMTSTMVTPAGFPMPKLMTNQGRDKAHLSQDVSRPSNRSARCWLPHPPRVSESFRQKP
jgi:hypothetical protein